MANLSMQVQKEAALLKGSHEQLRYGQSLMIALKNVDAELYVKVTGTEYDCFYDDDRVETFLNYLDKQWVN